MVFDYGMEGKKYLVTGASSGIGQAAAIHISQAGGRVVLNGRNEERLCETRSQMKGEGHFIMPFDLENLEGISGYVDSCVKLDGKKFDGLVFSTGIAGSLPIRMETLENAQRAMNINYFSYFMLMKAFVLRKNMNDKGAIVAISSNASIYPEKGQVSYGGGKAAVDICSEIAAQELVNRGIRVNTVNPHITNTPMSADFFSSPEVQKESFQNAFFPLGVLSPEDVANTIVFLLSDISGKITGQHICLSGGNFGRKINYFEI